VEPSPPTIGGGSGPPLTHPKAAGLEAAVAHAVQEAMSRYGGGNGGGNGGDIGKRVLAIEVRLETIERTMVTKEVLQQELRLLHVEIVKIPFETIKWVLLAAGTIAAIIYGAYSLFIKHV
jgi:hypothetical protein